MMSAPQLPLQCLRSNGRTSVSPAPTGHHTTGLPAVTRERGSGPGKCELATLLGSTDAELNNSNNGGP